MIARLRPIVAPALLSLAISLAVTASAEAGLGGAKAANGQPLFEFGMLGSGALTNPCTPSFSSCTLNATIKGNAISTPSTFTDTMTFSPDAGITSAGETCYVAAGNGTIVAKQGDQFTFTFNGLLCGDSSTFVPSSLNATYIVTGGTGRFANSSGQGNFTQNNIVIGSETAGPAKAGQTLSGSAAIVRFDGVLTMTQASSKPKLRAIEVGR
jgi:hypothetical protein